VPDTISIADGQTHSLDASTHTAEQGALIASIEAAQREQKFALVAERAASLRQGFPHLRLGYRAGADALRELGLLDEAAALLQDAKTRFHEEPWLLAAFATLAAQRGDWEEATEWSATLRRGFPAVQDGYRLELV
jgi:hypothetical protein